MVAAVRDGNVISFGGEPVSQAMLFGAFEQVSRTMGRLDGEAVYEFHREIEAEAFSAWRAAGREIPRGILRRWDRECELQGRRNDALGPGVSAFPNELEFLRLRELEQVRRPLNGKRLLPTNREVPLGAREHGWARRVGRGEAVVTRGDTQNYGHAQTGRIKEMFDVIYIVCSVRQTYFEMLSTDYAGVDQYGADLRQAYRLVDEKYNDILFRGWSQAKVYGMLNHPQLLKRKLGVVFGGPNTSTPAQIVAAVNAFVDAPANYSGDAMQPTILAVSPRIYRHMAQTRMSSDDPTKIRDEILQGQDKTNGIRDIVKVQELEGVGPDGEDGMFAFRDEQDAACDVEVAPTMTLPVYQASALSWQTIVVSATGGCLMPDVGHNALGYAEAPQI